MTAARTTAAAAAAEGWIRHPDQVRRRAGRAIWDAAESEPDPLAAIDAARRLAADLVDRLARTAPEGDHLATCLAHARGPDPGPADLSLTADPGLTANPSLTANPGLSADPGLAADLALTRRGRRCRTDREGAGTTFGGLLVLGALTGAPIGLLLRSCRDPRHTAGGHESTLRGWVLRDRHAHPLSRGAVRTIAHAGRRPHPALPRHPEEGTQYEKAYSLYAEGEEG
ncbi:hypothetical protein ABH926_007595 [Catenulispora sp. GP43]|uniref:hypothetical protein n=1 Tax=Catenulispora sp. GP43 TaxID=3156263 RepID=UPI0035197B89